MIGTRGVPARYGGFETAVEEIGRRLAAHEHEIVVYSRGEEPAGGTYLGMQVISLPAVKRKSLETLSHTLLSVVHIARSRPRPDAALVFNSANAPFIRSLQRLGVPTAVNVDGLEWKRAKWSGIAARYYRWAEAKAVKTADAVIADAQGIADHLRKEYQRNATVIPYGAPIIEPDPLRLSNLSLRPDGYHLVVARFEPENHVLEIVRAYRDSRASLPLVLVGGAPYADRYVQQIDQVVRSDRRIISLGGVWDQGLLDQLYAGARSYLHGHSVGGTNPSLLRALGAGAPVTAFDVVFNREVTGGHARFFDSVRSAAECIEMDDRVRDEDRAVLGRRHVAEHYRWDDVTKGYLEVCRYIVEEHRQHRSGGEGDAHD